MAMIIIGVANTCGASILELIGEEWGAGGDTHLNAPLLPAESGRMRQYSWFRQGEELGGKAGVSPRVLTGA